MKFEFTRRITAETSAYQNRAFDVGEQIEQSELLTGVFDSLQRQGILVPVAEQTPDGDVPPADPAPADGGGQGGDAGGQTPADRRPKNRK